MKLIVGSIKELKRITGGLVRIAQPQPKSLPESSGVYLWVFTNGLGEDLFYVGRARNLKVRLHTHLAFMNDEIQSCNTSPKHSRASRKYRDSARMFILEQSPETAPVGKDTVTSLEKFWILYFWRKFGPKRVLNVELVPGSSKYTDAARVKMSALHRKRFRDDPVARARMSDKVKRQWENPKFVEANQRRLKELRDTGWTSSRVQILSVVLPDRTRHVITRKCLQSVLQLGSRTGGFLSFFTNNKLFNDWTVVEYAKLGGNKFLDSAEQFAVNEARFCSNVFVKWLSEYRKQVGEKAFSVNPIKFESDDAVYKHHATSVFRVGGQVKVTNGVLLYHYHSLYEYAKDPTAIYRP